MPPYSTPLVSSSCKSRPNLKDLQQHFFLMLQHCKSMAELARLHAQLLVNGFFHKNFLLTKLLSFCISSGDLAHAVRAFDQVEEPSTTLCNQMIRAFLRGGSPECSLGIYRQMMMHGRGGAAAKRAPQPNGFTYAFLLGACARSGTHLARLGEQLHARVVSEGFGSSVYVQTNLVNMYATSSEESLTKARMMFDDMPQRNIVSWNSMLAGYLRSGDVSSACRLFDHMPCTKDKVSWTTMIVGFMQAGKCQQALALFGEMRRAHVSADHVTMISVLSSCACLGALDIGRCIHALIYRVLRGGGRGFESLSNVLIHMYVKCGAVNDAFQAFQEMPSRTTVSWTTMIAGFAMHGRSDDALNVFHKMQQLEGAENQKPDWSTLMAVLCACSYSGRITEGHRYFGEMISIYGIAPRIQHYGCMIDMLSRAGHLAAACELIEMMPMRPNVAVWGALLGGCSRHGDVELARQVIESVLELKPDDELGYLLLLSSLYAEASKWSAVHSIKERMLRIGLSKATAAHSLVHYNATVIPGLSYIS